MTTASHISVLAAPEEYLRRYEHTVIIVSHDRAFLDAVCTDIIYFHHHFKKLEYYPGDFSSFIKARDDKVKKKARMQEALDAPRPRAPSAHPQRTLSAHSAHPQRSPPPS